MIIKAFVDHEAEEDFPFRIGQRVLISKSEFGVGSGTYVGSAEIQNKNRQMETLAVVRLDPQDQGYLKPKNEDFPTNVFISTILVQPKYLIFNLKD